MSILDKKYVLKVDTKSTFFNPTPQFSISDNETSDFNIRVTNANKIINLSDVIAVMVVINPNNEMYSDFVEVEKAEEGLLYCNLSQSLKNIDGTWKARLMCIYGEERIVTSTFSYKVNTDEFVQLNQEVVTDDRFGTLTQMLSRLSSIELQETSRKLAELSREEAERQRELVKEKLISDIEKLIQDTNSKVDTNLKENTAKIDILVTDTNKKIDDYKLAKDEAIQQDLQLYKQETTENINTYKNDKNIEIDNYKNAKDTEINKNLSDYKNSTTTDIETYKNSKDEELDNYKIEKDKFIDSYVTAKNKELDNYKLAKNTEINEFKDLKDAEINNKLREVDVEEQKRAEAEQQRVTDHAERETFLNSFESQLEQIVLKDVEQDGRLNSIEYVNKRQDVMLGGLFNENADGRLSIEGEGNNIKLEGSKEGLVEVEKVVGDTMVNLASISSRTLTYEDINSASDMQIQFLKPNTVYTIILSTKYTNDGDVGGIKLLLSDSTNVTLTGSLTNSETLYKFVATTPSDVSNFVLSATGNYITIHNLVILEGDYTNKPIPSEYFEGMQSCFEDKLIDDVNNPNNGKYEVDIKVVGKNKFDGEVIEGKAISIDGTISDNASFYVTDYIKVNKGMKIATNRGKATNWAIYDINKKIIKGIPSQIYIQIEHDGFIRVHCSYIDKSIKDFQVEEGTVATPYEPYKEFNQSLYLNEPLYKDNGLCVHNGQLGYWKNCEIVVFDGSSDETIAYVGAPTNSTISFRCGGNVLREHNSRFMVCDRFLKSDGLWIAESEGFVGFANSTKSFDFRIMVTKLSTQDADGFRKWLQANPTTVIYELAEPIFVPILENTPQWILDSYNSCTVHFETNVPILSSSFKYTGGIPSVMVMDRSISDIKELNVDMVATNFDMDYRLLEVEWALEDAGITGISLANILNTNKGVKNMALSRYEQAKIMILGGAYEKETLTRQLTRYVEKKIITQQEYDELIALMEAKELVTGE